MPHNLNEVDLSQKPLFLLLENKGERGGGHVFFDTMEVPDDEWEEWKSNGEQIDNRIVEVVWDAGAQTWKKLRFRDDKLEGNYTTVVQKIIESIKDGVEQEVVSLADVPACAVRVEADVAGPHLYS